MNGAINLGSLINEKVLEYFYETGVKPSDMFISPHNYRYLLELKATEQSNTYGTAGFAALKEISTPLGRLSIVIDEMLPDTKIVFASHALQ
jgi:hypothetical protein